MCNTGSQSPEKSRALFLTSKVRLHCDFGPRRRPSGPKASFPDLQGQAPLRPIKGHVLSESSCSFPDLQGQAPLRRLNLTCPTNPPPLFLTSKVRLHCDRGCCANRGPVAAPFPDLQGQAPLRHGVALLQNQRQEVAFPDLQGQAPLRPVAVADTLPLHLLFLTSKVRLHCDGLDALDPNNMNPTFPDLQGQAPLRPIPVRVGGCVGGGFS